MDCVMYSSAFNCLCFDVTTDVYLCLFVLKTFLAEWLIVSCLRKGTYRWWLVRTVNGSIE